MSLLSLCFWEPMVECSFLLCWDQGTAHPPLATVDFWKNLLASPSVSLSLSIEPENVRGCVNEHSKVVWIKLNPHLQNIVAFWNWLTWKFLLSLFFPRRKKAIKLMRAFWGPPCLLYCWTSLKAERRTRSFSRREALSAPQSWHCLLSRWWVFKHGLGIDCVTKTNWESFV